MPLRICLFPKQEPFGVLSSERKSVTRLARWVSRASGLWSPIMNTIGAIGAGWVSRARACSLPWSPIMSAIGANWGWVSDHEQLGPLGPGGCLPWSPIMSWVGVTRSGLWSRAGVTRFGPVVSMVSDHEHNWGYWGRAGVTRSGLQSAMVSDHEHNGGQVGPGACHGRVSRVWDLRSPTLSDHEHNWGLPWSPIMSRVGVTRSGSGLWSPMVSDHEHNWGYWGWVGVTCSGLRSPMVSDHERNWVQLGPAGCHALRGLWSPTVSAGRVSRGSGP